MKTLTSRLVHAGVTRENMDRCTVTFGNELFLVLVFTLPKANFTKATDILLLDKIRWSISVHIIFKKQCWLGR